MGDVLEDAIKKQAVPLADCYNEKHDNTDTTDTLKRLIPVLQQKIMTNSLNTVEVESLLGKFDPAMLGPLMEIVQYLQQRTDKGYNEKHSCDECIELCENINSSVGENVAKSAQVLGVDIGKITEVLGQVIENDNRFVGAKSSGESSCHSKRNGVQSGEVASSDDIGAATNDNNISVRTFTREETVSASKSTGNDSWLSTFPLELRPPGSQIFSTSKVLNCYYLAI